MRFVILGCALLLAGVARVQSAVYYVDYAGGSDANVGTNGSQPWKHCPGDPAAGGVAAGVNLAPGDVVRFKGGVEYELRGATGIRLAWDGAAGAAITYDGNSDGSWGAGRAVLTDRNGGNGISVFLATGLRRHLRFTSFEFSAVGGAAVLPGDGGGALQARFGGGLAFPAGAEEVVVEDSFFHDLGYWQNVRPLAAASLAGCGISGQGRLRLVIVRCQFSHVAKGCDFSGANDYSQVKLEQCSFGAGVVWPLDLPAAFGQVSLLSLELKATPVPGWAADYAAAGWAGYGLAPLTEQLTVAYGEALVFSVSAIASPEASFQWYRNGVAIPGGVTYRLDLGVADAADAGIYTVVATNPFGTATSNSVEVVLTGQPPPPDPTPVDPNPIPNPIPNPGPNPVPVDGAVAPIFAVQPLSRTVSPGSIVTLAVFATGTPTPTYQWYKDGSAIPGARSAALSLVSFSANDTGTYRAVAVNAGGTAISEPAVLQLVGAAPLNIAPSILQHPASASVSAGNPVSFSVVASGVPAPSYQWQKNGSPIPGATHSVLSFTAVTSADAAGYRVVVSNAAGAVTSNSATLSVIEAAPVQVAPVIAQQPVNLTVDAGGSATFAVVASGTPAPAYRWEKDGVAIPGAVGPSLTLTPVTAADAADYRVVVANAAGSVTSATATLTVVQPSPYFLPPAITLQPVAASVLTGSPATFTVAAVGDPTPTYQWQKNGVNIPGATWPAFTVTNVMTNDAGTYRVIVSNAAGSVISHAVELAVIQAPSPFGAPTIFYPPTSLTVERGKTATFAVAATGNPIPTYQWQKNGANIPGATSAALSLFAVTAADAGTYRVVISNSVGSITSPDAVLTVLSPAGSVEAAIVTVPAPLVFEDLNLRNGHSFVSATFTIPEGASRRVLVRALGPSYAAVGGSAALADPKLDLYLGTGGPALANDNWSGDAEIALAVAQVGGSPFTGPGSRDAALIATAPPGTHVVVISSVGAVTGHVLAEVYLLP